jgi:deazaflavin-dependent oxidoreductase (nitroreductase family)
LHVAQCLDRRSIHVAVTDDAVPTEDDAERVREAARNEASRHTSAIRSARGGRILSAAMLPLFLLKAPAGFGVITTTGRRSGKTRRKCVRVIRRGDKAFLIQLRPPIVALDKPQAVAGWVWNLRASPHVRLRLGARTCAGVAREIDDPSELQEARRAMTEGVHWFDYAECDFHLKGFPTRAKIEELHRFWFDTGIALVIDLAG